MSLGADPEVAWSAAVRLSAAFSAACGELPNIFSEGNPAGRVFHRWALPMAAGTPLDAASLAAALQVEPPEYVALVPLTDQFDLEPANWGEETALGYRLLAGLMRATLDDVHVAWVRGGATASVPTYVFGRLEGGPLTGVRVITIET